MRKQFKDTIMDLSLNDGDIVLVFGDVSVYLFDEFKQKYPSRFYNMGICENTLISVSGGLSSQGFTPFVHTITPFLTERSLEQVKLDLCYNRYPVNLVTCGASFDYAWDGVTHHSYTDLANLRLLPEMEVLQPGSVKELDILLRSQYNNDKTTYFRLSDHPHHVDVPVEFGKGVVIRDVGADLTVMTAGPILENVLHAVSDLDVNLVYFHTIKPIDTEVINKFKRTRIVVIHDAHGLFEAIAEVPELNLSYHGMGDFFLDCYGTIGDIHQKIGLDPEGIKTYLRSKLWQKGKLNVL
jgi:transketolase